MKYLKAYRKSKNKFIAGDKVVLIKPVKNKSFEVGEIYTINSCDHRDILEYEIFEPNKQFGYWFKSDSLRRATEEDISAKKFNL